MHFLWFLLGNLILIKKDKSKVRNLISLSYNKLNSLDLLGLIKFAPSEVINLWHFNLFRLNW